MNKSRSSLKTSILGSAWTREILPPYVSPSLGPGICSYQQEGLGGARQYRWGYHHVSESSLFSWDFPRSAEAFYCTSTVRETLVWPDYFYLILQSVNEINVLVSSTCWYYVHRFINIQDVLGPYERVLLYCKYSSAAE